MRENEPSSERDTAAHAVGELIALHSFLQVAFAASMEISIASRNNDFVNFGSIPISSRNSLCWNKSCCFKKASLSLALRYCWNHKSSSGITEWTACTTRKTVSMCKTWHSCSICDLASASRPGRRYRRAVPRARILIRSSIIILSSSDAVFNLKVWYCPVYR